MLHEKKKNFSPFLFITLAKKKTHACAKATSAYFYILSGDKRYQLVFILDFYLFLIIVWISCEEKTRCIPFFTWSTSKNFNISLANLDISPLHTTHHCCTQCHLHITPSCARLWPWTSTMHWPTIVVYHFYIIIDWSIRMGLEPVTFRLLARCSNQLSQ